MANNKQDTERELFAVVDYILNRANEREIDVISAALERKKHEASAASPLSAINPENMAKQMSESINKSIQASLEGVRHTFRDFAADMLLKEAPELSEDQMKALIDSWIPEQGSYDGSIKSLAKNGKIDGLPADVLYGMILQFVSYSIGEMSAKENDELKTTMGNWTEKYWSRFPMRVKQEIKSFINGEITSGEFKKNITALIF
ncbi:hypothetical protein E4O00_08880 [Treponema sp. OMZ 788]|uniref:hypothetical protein n=1 Tax=unclassified Treponema TaxID=2638727 RepID=UPI0020A4B870|nr:MULTISPECIES: hypothetical protein [unclassified Treponema]UTC63169.1 hypothetical protein E4O05_04550 [Treponema sp. OMZ 787]UTC63992.1 hypothetical protein E4O00_08880 [Treponema sp. OMZ 788]